jgi:hypothetical protein
METYLDDYPAVFVFRALLTSVHAELGREDQARPDLDRLAEDTFAELHTGMDWFLGASVLAWVCSLLEDAERARPLYDALLPYADYNIFAMPEVSLGSASRPLGVLAATMSRWDEAAHHFEQAVEMNARMGARPWVAHTRHEHALMLMRRREPGDHERAAELLEAARRGYADLGMASWERSATSDREHVMA